MRLRAFRARAQIGFLGNVCGARPEMSEQFAFGKDRVRNARCLAIGRREREHVQRRFEGKRAGELLRSPRSTHRRIFARSISGLTCGALTRDRVPDT